MKARAFLRRVALLSLSGAAALAAAEPRGRAVYEQYCAACHGADGSGGMPGVADLVAAAGPLARPDAELLASLRDGVSRPGSPVIMPPRGGNPALTDADLHSVLRYLRELTGVAPR